MKKLLILGLTLSLPIGQIKAIRDYKRDLTKIEKSQFGNLTKRKTHLKDFVKYIEQKDNYKITNIANPNIAERLLKSSKNENLIEWNSTILIYSILNEIEEQITSGIRMGRFEKILTRALEEINEKGKLQQEILEKIIYETSEGKESFLKIYMTELISKLRIMTPALKTSLKWLNKELKRNLCVSEKTKYLIILDDRFENITNILKAAPYLVLDQFYNTNIENYIDANISEDDETIALFKREILLKIENTKKSIKNHRASFKLNVRNIFF